MDYYGRLCTLWEEFVIYRPLPMCTCGAACEIVQERDEEKVHQFILGLDDSRRTKQWVLQLAKSGASVRGEDHRGSRPEQSLLKKSMQCSNCGRGGHEKKDCWQLVGFPEWYTKRNNGRRGGSRGCGGRGSSAGRGRGQVTDAHATSSNASVFPDFTNEQWQVLTQMIQVKSAHGGADKLSGKAKFGDVILDSGASHHMTGDKSLLVDLDRFTGTLIGRGEECDGVYFLTDVATAKVHTVQASQDLTLWHQRLGHPKKQFGKTVKVVQSDNGTEFMCLSSYFREHSIVHQTSCVGTPQQNGRVERKNRHILNVSRALLFQANFPVSFWGEAVFTAAYLINRTPSFIHEGRSPYEILHGQKPDYTQLRVFGSACYVHRITRDKDKFGERSRLCVFVGYPFGKKGWKVYDVERKEFLVSRDVIFNEDVFLFAANTPSLLPTSEVREGDRDVPCDDDWIIYPTSKVREGDHVVCPPSTSVDSPAEVALVESSADVIEDPPSDVVSETLPTAIDDPVMLDAEESLFEVQLDRGQQERIPSTRLKDFVTYNISALPHNTHHAILNSTSVSSSTVQASGVPCRSNSL
ncbi:uncharacterized protein LOC112083045 [Eutrema salsugineum]|uniref:uncharacterized protein LOC112083045 n=1 Tax=Eutrema salsugineum TaxID=72664 RepID=UPI000CECFD0C|nr:uncharacterized protein LOC112083045 [Eutrema salsugineum]